jgi:ABC-type lipoprotein export system ATPase subunit
MTSPENPSSVSTGDIAVQVVQVAKSYGSSWSGVHALRGVSFAIHRQERLACLGKSGGKSTLLNILGGLDRPTSGVWVGGHDLAHLTPNELARYRLTTVGMIFQAYNLITSRTVLENIELPMVFAGRRARERRAAARLALEAVGLGQRLHHLPSELSGGEQQRVAIARALVNHPAILLADEPTGNLDSATAREIAELLISYLRNHGTTLVLVTHDEELARGCADRILHLQDGQIIPCP